MPVTKFPNPKHAGPDGILALGGDLHPESLLLAYRQGIFPWPMEGYPLAWFCPEKRAILDFKELHIPRSLAKFLRTMPYRMTINQAFPAVIEACSLAPRPGQDGTWITPEMVEAYQRLHRLGYAISAEAWEGEILVGGIYGVIVDGLFAGESMFHLKENASKAALLHLIEALQGQGFEWIDIQVLTPHMEHLGAREISRDLFLRKLAHSRARFEKALEKPESFGISIRRSPHPR